jgi:nucleoid-associated protein YgaU
MANLYPVRGLVEHTSDEFRRELVATAERLGVDPTDLAAVMSFETGGTFSPKIKNPLSGATGLIQWMPATARAFGTTTAELARLSAVQQLVWVEKYFARYRNRSLTTHELYMVVFWGSPVGVDTVLGVRDDPSRSGAVYRQNAGLDGNHDGRILAGEASQQVRNLAAAARRSAPLVIPKAGEDSSGSPSPSVPGGSSEPRVHVVRSGETCWIIATKYTKQGARWKELTRLNPELNDSAVIYPGQKLKLPESWTA